LAEAAVIYVGFFQWLSRGQLARATAEVQGTTPNTICSIAMTTSLPSFRDDKPPDITSILVSYNTSPLLGRLFAALDAARGMLRLQIIIVDNASRDDSVAILRSHHPDVELIENQTNVGFGRANNQALPLVRGRYVLLLNTDAFVSPDTLQKTVNFMDATPRCGVVGVKLVGPDGSLQPSCRYFPTPWNSFLVTSGLFRFFSSVRLVDDLSWDHATIRECDWVPGCYYLIRREVIDQVGLFDPRYFMYFEEVDHCRAVRKAGWSVIYYPWTQVIHIGGESAVSSAPLTHAGRQISALQIESELLYFRKHHGLSGVLTSVCLTMLAYSVKACSALIKRRDPAESAAAIRYPWAVLKLLVDTRLASRPTR
jgi:N-acetylglucosaminyl-diphospho-decaprenol L-rhamnosyltransferase